MIVRRPLVNALAVVSCLTLVAALSGCGAGSNVGGVADAATSPPSSITTTSTSSTSTTTTTVVTTTTEPLPPNLVSVPVLAEPLVAVDRENGPETARVQERLIELGFWLDAIDGIYGHVTRQAVMAFQKYWGLPATGRVDDTTAAAMSTSTERARGLSVEGHLVEIDKSRQLLFLIKDGHTVWTVNASTGSEVPYEMPNQNDPTKIERGDSITPVGRFTTNREREEGWWEGDLGQIYRPKYFRGGVAVHGSLSIPNTAASRGCVRVSVAAMDMIWEAGLVPLRTTVWVHGEIPTVPL